MTTTKPTKFTVYRVTGPDGRCYIGATKESLKERWYRHCWDAAHHRRGSPALHQAIRLHGPAQFQVEAFCAVTTREEALEIEAELIELHGTLVPGGFNARVGTKHTPGTREKMRLAAIGRQHTPETRERMSLAKRGESNPHAKLTADKVTWARKAVAFKSRSQVAAALGVGIRTLDGVLYGSSWSHLTA